MSKGLGIGIIAGSILVKVPQILKILSSKSAEGINIYGVYLELFAITANFAYSYVMGFTFRFVFFSSMQKMRYIVRSVNLSTIM